MNIPNGKKEVTYNLNFICSFFFTTNIRTYRGGLCFLKRLMRELNYYF